MVKTKEKIDSDESLLQPVSQNKKWLVITVALQILGLVFLIAAGFVSSVIGNQSKVYSDQVDEIVSQYHQVKEDIVDVDSEISAVPSTSTALRWVENARTHGDAVADRQNLLMSEVIELSYEGIEETYDEPGQQDPVKYTPEERKEMAEAARDERIAAAIRDLTSLFASEDIDQLGFNASEAWYKQLGIEPSKDRVWSFSVSGYFDEVGRVPVSWTMSQGEGEKIAVITANYDTQRRVFTDLSAMRVLEPVEGEN